MFHAEAFFETVHAGRDNNRHKLRFSTTWKIVWLSEMKLLNLQDVLNLNMP